LFAGFLKKRSRYQLKSFINLLFGGEDISTLLNWHTVKEILVIHNCSVKHISEFFNYINNNINIIVNYGERWRKGKRILTSFVESLVNYFVSKRFCKKQQMQWGKEGAHLLIQVRAKVINDELRQIFKGWYQDFDIGPNISENTANVNAPIVVA
jgi:hypothetical protein